ncbi:MAG: hypothetical protein ACLURP_15465 [Ruminococcus sp.]
MVGKEKVNRIGVQCFGATGLEQFCVNAKNIDSCAFIGCEDLKKYTFAAELRILI